MYDLVLDMETGDPDDALTLCLVATHPLVNLKGVTVFPGGRDQVGLVRHILKLLGKDKVPVGAGTPKKPDAKYVSGFHTRWLGDIQPEDADMGAADLISLLAGRQTSLLTGAPLTNVLRGYEVWRKKARGREAFFGEWTCQGGFVGGSLMPRDRVLEKFVGPYGARETCPTWNLGGDVKAAETLLDPRWETAPAIDIRRLVPKSVCHGIFYTQEVHARIPRGAHPGLDLFKAGMDVYFKKKPEGKALHDIVAAAVAIRPSIGTWTQVRPFRDAKTGEWGCKAAAEPTALDPTKGIEPAPIFALTRLDMDGFEKTLSG